MVKTVELVDAQEMARLHPITFQAPDNEELASIRKGDYVKVCAEPKRFWILVIKTDGDTLTGSVNNDLVFTDVHGLRDEDVIQFEKRHIYQVG